MMTKELDDLRGYGLAAKFRECLERRLGFADNPAELQTGGGDASRLHDNVAHLVRVVAAPVVVVVVFNFWQQY